LMPRALSPAAMGILRYPLVVVPPDPTALLRPLLRADCLRLAGCRLTRVFTMRRRPPCA
jgi:hypothetical protein